MTEQWFWVNTDHSLACKMYIRGRCPAAASVELMSSYAVPTSFLDIV